MKPRFICLLSFLFLLSLPSLQSQTLDWIQLGGSSCCFDYANGIVKDQDGNMYFHGRILGPGQYDTVPLSTAAFLIKCDREGKAIWGGNTPEEYLTDIAVDDKHGVIYTLGIVLSSPVGPAFGKISITQYAKDGSITSTFSIDKPSTGSSITVDSEGNIYVGGMLGNRPYLGKYMPDGTTIWEKEFDGTDVDVHSPVLDDNGAVYALLTIGHSGPIKSFSLLKLNQVSGDLLWQVNAAGHRIFANDLLLDWNGDILIAGSYSDSLTLGEAVLEREQGTSFGFIARCDASGNVTTTVAAANSSFNRIDRDDAGDIVLTGGAGGNVVIESEVFAFTRDQAIVAKFDPNLKPVWLVGTGSTSAGYSGITTVGSDIYVLGTIQTSLAALGGISLPPHGNNVFLAKLAKNVSSVEVSKEVEGGVTVVPNPVLHSTQLQVPDNVRIEEIQIHDVAGRLIQSLEENVSGKNIIDLNLQGIPAGLYYVSLRGEGTPIVLPVMKASND